MFAKAVQVGEAVKEMADKFYPPSVPGSQLARADLDVYHAQGLIYLGRAEAAITLLKRIIDELERGQRPEDLARQGDPHGFTNWRRNLILGRGHNNLGYAYRLQREGHYSLALEEFRDAVSYFRASDLLEEYANTCDNMGRVYALLYQRSRAESLTDDALDLRRQLGRDYRIALSLNSRAIVHLVFDEPHRARRLSEEALSIFERLGVQRGIGLASITSGRSLRGLGALWSVGLYPPEVCDNYFREAETHLEHAISVFEKTVPERLRLIEVYNEMGCIYRERAALARRDVKSPMARSISRDAVQYLTKSIQLAEEDYPVLYVDSCEDLAQTYFQRRDYNYAELWLQKAEGRIPDKYKIKEGSGIGVVPLEECVEEFWQQLGKIDLLRGYLAYETGTTGEDGEIAREALELAVRHFTFAAAYFEHYSERATGLETTFKQLYDRFKQCRYEDLRHIQDQLLPEIERVYALDPTHVARFFEDTLGLALQFYKK
jgi:tetratricopeptide (TPR) repeat protein